jgi:hypothetical protein
LEAESEETAKSIEDPSKYHRSSVVTSRSHHRRHTGAPPEQHRAFAIAASSILEVFRPLSLEFDFGPLDMGRISPHTPSPMSKVQFMVLNLVGGVCSLLIVCDLVLGYLNGHLNQSVSATRNQFGQAQQVQNTAQNLVMRVAQAGQTDAVLRELLAKHDFKVNVNTNSQPQPTR